MNLVVNIVVYQICWFACILGGANELPLLGVLAVAFAVVYHLHVADRPGAELALLGIAAIIGGVWDSLLVTAGWLVYPSGTLFDGTAPYWIVALWISFATTFNVSLRWFKKRLLMAATFGAIGGPLAFFAGERLGGVVFANPVAGLTALALGWAVLMPLMMAISNRWDGFRRAELTRPAYANYVARTSAFMPPLSKKYDTAKQGSSHRG